MNPFDISAAYRRITEEQLPRAERPLIGITGNFGERGSELAEGYYASVEAAGGVPLVIPPGLSPEALCSLLDRIDGVLLSGGADVNPLFVGEEPIPQLGGINPRRDASELLLVRLAYDRQIPLFGICRGIQVLAMALGGSVHQDLGACLPEAKLLKHSQNLERGVASHKVEAEEGSLMHRLLGKEIFVNSFHHQAVNEPGPRLRVTARSADGVVEAVESTEKKSIYGVQWHPECFLPAGNECMMPLFRHFVGEAASFRAAREAHRAILTLDSHCDTPMFFDRDIRFGCRDEQILMDLHKMTEGHLDAAIMVAYLPQKGCSEQELATANAEANRLLTEIEKMVAACPAAAIARTPADLYRLKQAGQKAVLMGVENGYAFTNRLDTIAEFRRRGVVYTTLCHNGDNQLCDAASKSQGTHGGLSLLGRQAIEEMNRVGMMIDLSHAGEATFYQALELSSQPVVCSHSSARALCDHPRNLTDDQLRALAARGGVAQVTLYNGFLRTDGAATIDDAVLHLLHMVEVAGIDHVGIGTDFDGDGGVPGCASAAELLNFTRALMAEGFDMESLRKVWGGNFLRVMQQVQDAACADI